MRAAKGGGSVSVTVEDTGVGIAPEQLPLVFQRFWQADGTHTRRHGGLGIGLALARGIVELHGGAIGARSAGLGHGSEFVLHLPVAARAAPGGQSVGRDAAHAAQPLKVLVADDNADAAETLTLLLRLDGHEVRTANDGMRALELAREFQPDVALLDIGMPGLNGFELATAIRREPWARSTRLVAVTGWGKDQDKQRSAEAGFDQHLTKPVNPDALKPLMARR